MAERPVLRTSPEIMRPPNQAPTDSPNMKTESTTERTGVMIPNEAKARRVQTI